MLEVPEQYGGMKRFRDVLATLAKHGMGHFLEYVGLKKSELGEIGVRPTPERIRVILEDLGGSFVKLGQLLSLRPDLIPARYCREFSKLQDEVRPVPPEDIDEVVQEEIGDDLHAFMTEPIASASVGQVHEGSWKDGRKVAVKVKRPGIGELMYDDIKIMTYVAKKIEKHFKPEIFSPVDIVAEFKDYTLKELDYREEAENLKRMYDNFRKTNVIIPRVYESTKDVLVMEFVEGSELKKLIDEQGGDKKKLAKTICESVFKQVFDDGFFHADPHPGNIFVSGGNVAFLDLGIVGSLSDKLRDAVTDLFIAIIRRDSDKVAKAFRKMGVAGNADMESFKEDLHKTFSAYYDMDLKDIKLSELIHQCIGIARRNDLSMPRNLVLLGKSVMTLESTCTELYPGFDVMEVAKPYVAKLIGSKPKRALKHLASKSGDLVDFMLSAPERDEEEQALMRHAEEEMEKLDFDLRRFEKEVSSSTYKVIAGVVAASLIVSSALVSGVPQGTMFGFPQVSFVALVISGVLLLALGLTWLEERTKWHL